MQFLYLVLACWSCGSAVINNPKNDKPSMEKFNGLQLKLEILIDSIYQNQPLPIKATLSNSGSEALMVNSRLALGYENSLSRELFAEITRKNDQQPAAFHPLDINRDFSGPSDYTLLEPGHSVSTTFNLFDFYQILNPGKYKLTLYYEADEPLAQTPKEVFRGRVESPTLSLEILPGRLPEIN